jgi:hypothetical protein
MAAAEACTCVLGHPDHKDGCDCTTAIMDCPVHGGGDLGRIERELLELRAEHREEEG